MLLFSSQMYHIHNISNTPFLMSDIILMYDWIRPAESTTITILWNKTNLLFRRRKESTLSPWHTSIEHIPKRYTRQFIYFLMRTSLIMMVVKILHFGQINFDNLLLIQLIVTHVTKDIEQYFDDFLIYLKLGKFYGISF